MILTAPFLVSTGKLIECVGPSLKPGVPWSLLLMSDVLQMLWSWIDDSCWGGACYGGDYLGYQFSIKVFSGEFR